MKQIIADKVYDTDTATEVCDISPSGYSVNDFDWENTQLYRSPKGAFFLAGQGNARSRWAQPVLGGAMGGSGMKVLSLEHAKKLASRHLSVEEYAKFFGEPEEG